MGKMLSLEWHYYFKTYFILIDFKLVFNIHDVDRGNNSRLTKCKPNLSYTFNQTAGGQLFESMTAE